MQNGKTEHFLAGKLFWVSRLSMEAAEQIMPMIRDETMKLQVSRQLETYRTIAARSAEILQKYGLDPVEKAGLMDWLLRKSIEMDTSWNQSTSHLAKIAIHCTDAAMNNLIKTINKTAADDLEINILAEKYLDEGQKDIEFLKKYI
ncbi:MAG: DUF892 domain-containing protein [Oscillospiraceae bacterium]|jgi:hypothetical protein